MKTREPPPASPAESLSNRKAAKADRLAREAAALRANLRKRKEQARERAAPSEPPKQE